MLSLTTIQDRRLNEFLQDEEELPRFWLDTNGYARDRDNGNKFCKIIAFTRQEKQLTQSIRRF